MPSSSSASPSLLVLTLAAGAAAAVGWAALTPPGQAWARRVWEGDVEGARRRKAMKQLGFLERRLAELGAQIEACGRRLDAVEAGEGAGSAPEEEVASSSKPVSAYYHFDSSGRKFANKWDTYDVDGELARLDAEEEEGEEAEGEGGQRGGRQRPQQQPQPRGRGGKVTLGMVRTEVGQLNHDLERLMGYLDQVRGDEAVKTRRRALVQASHGVFERLDALTQRLMG